MKLKKLLLLDIRSDVGYLSHLSARFWICVSIFAISLLAIPSFLYTTFNRRLAAATRRLNADALLILFGFDGDGLPTVGAAD